MENNQVCINELIDNLKINDKMKAEFKKLNFMYYPNYIDGKITQPYFWKLSPEYMALELEEKKKVGIGGSLLGFFFGPFAYLFKGLFLKSFSLIAIAFFFAIVLPDGNISDIGMRIVGWSICIFCATMLRKDYFHKKCLNNKAIKAYIQSGQASFASAKTEALVEENKVPIETK